MKLMTNRYSWGLLLIAGGVILLLQNLSIIPDNAVLWAIIFGAFGLYFFVIFLSSQEHWWAAFPAFGLLGIGGTIVIAELTTLEEDWAAVVFLGAISLSFFLIYLRRRQHWWPLIPGGAIASITGIVAATLLDSTPPASLITSILFGGLALTFLLLYVAPAEAGRARWAIWPAASLLLVAIITSVAAFDLGKYIVPITLIVLGGAILLRNIRRN